MDDLILHSYRRCPFAIRVRMVLEEKHLAYELIEENLASMSEELLRLHPEGRVPLLIHHGVAIHESAIITQYLDEAFPNVTPSGPLMPSLAIERARMRLWTFWCDELFKPDLDRFKYEWKTLPEVERHMLLARLKGHLDKMESALEQYPYLLGESMTLADIHVFPFYRQLQKAHPDFSSIFHPQAVNRWLERITGRPSFSRVMKKVL